MRHCLFFSPLIVFAHNFPKTRLNRIIALPSDLLDTFLKDNGKACCNKIWKSCDFSAVKLPLLIFLCNTELKFVGALNDLCTCKTFPLSFVVRTYNAWACKIYLHWGQQVVGATAVLCHVLACLLSQLGCLFLQMWYAVYSMKCSSRSASRLAHAAQVDPAKTHIWFIRNTDFLCETRLGYSMVILDTNNTFSF